MSIRRQIRDDVRLDVVYEDETPFGSAVTGRADNAVRQACRAILEHRTLHGMADVVACSERLLTEAFSTGLAPFLAPPNSLQPACLFPPAERVRPVALAVTGEHGSGRVAVSPNAAAELASWIGELERGTSRPDSPTGSALFDGLESMGALSETRVDADPPLENADAVLVGHATVLVSGGSRVLVDPFLLPRARRYPPTYQPLRLADLAPDAVFITHSHPDHCDFGTLLRFGAHFPIYVPHVERESLLAVDMAARLRELGFANVRSVRPGDCATVGDTTVRVFPFFGEQPTTAEVLHPEVRNLGCTYLFEAGRAARRRVLLVADSGRDRDGDVRDVAGAVRQLHGEVDVLFGGYRAFAVYPIHYLFSSVARFLLFVPRSHWAVRQKTMNDASALLDTAERCGARYVLPYADGGAPWHWERGLGPRLDGTGTPHPSVDPPPDDVVRLASERSSAKDGPIPSPVRALVLRPGEGISLTYGGARVVRGPHQVWPYAPRCWLQLNAAFVRQNGSARTSARAVFRLLEPQLSRWRQDGRLDRFFFMRKPPDLRLRFLGDPSLQEDAQALVEGFVRDGFVERWFQSVYEPETNRFGGAEAMAAVHTWFDADSTAWMALDRLEFEGRRTTASELLCLAVADDLVSRSLPDRAEQWEVWASYAAALGASASEDAPQVERASLDSLELRATADERPVLAAYRDANCALSSALSELWARGGLTAGMRAVLGATVMFHFHRHGLDARAHARLAHGMVQALRQPALE